MGKKPLIIKLRVYKGKEVNYDSNGKIKNENQAIKIFYDSVEWRNQLKNLKVNGYSKVEVESANYVSRNKDLTETIEPLEDTSKIIEEVKIAFEGDNKPKLTPDQERIAKLEEMIEKLTKSNIKEKESSKKEKSIEDIRVEYEEVFGEKPHHMTKAETLLQKIKENKNKS